MFSGWAAVASSSLEDSPRSAGTYQITVSSLGPAACEILCVPFKSEVSISPSPLGLQKERPAGLQSQCSGGSSSQCKTPRLGSLMWGLGLSLLWENLCICNYSPICGSPTWGMGLDYIATPPTPTIFLLFLLFIFSCRRSFLVGFDPFHQWLLCW